jgi:hypothetical protein
VPDNIGLLYRRHLAMFGPREMLLSSQEPVVRQFLNAQKEGPIGMAEEKDAAELEAEGDAEMPPLPPIPPQITPSSGEPRRTQRPAGQWLEENRATPPPGSFEGDEGYSAAVTGSDARGRDDDDFDDLDEPGDGVTALSGTDRLRRPRSQRATSKTGGGQA